MYTFDLPNIISIFVVLFVIAIVNIIVVFWLPSGVEWFILHKIIIIFLN